MIEDKNRHIPIELRRRILVEAGHRCAIPICRTLKATVHHIVPWEKSKKHEYKNLIALCPNCHDSADRGDIDKKSLYMYKDNLRYIFEKYSQFEIDVLYKLSKIPEDEGLSIPTDLYLLVNRILEDKLIKFEIVPGIKINIASSFDLTPATMLLTKKGKDFIQNIENKKIGYDNL